MRVVHTDNPLPRDWAGPPGADKALLLASVGVSCNSRLRAKVVIFSSKKDMRKFWTDTLDCEDPGTHCPAVVNPLSVTVVSFKDGVESPPVERVDPRYFAVLGMVWPACDDIEVLSHEAAHLALAYVRRVGNKGPKWDENGSEDEPLCYATGRLTAALVDIVSGFKRR